MFNIADAGRAAQQADRLIPQPGEGIQILALNAQADIVIAPAHLHAAHPAHPHIHAIAHQLHFLNLRLHPVHPGLTAELALPQRQQLYGDAAVIAGLET